MPRDLPGFTAGIGLRQPTKKVPPLSLLQQRLYVGQPPARLMDRIEEAPLQFHYEIIDIRTVDCREPLADPEIEDNLSALLCRMEDRTAEDFSFPSPAAV